MNTSKPTLLLVSLVCALVAVLVTVFSARGGEIDDHDASSSENQCSIGRCETVSVDSVIDGDTLDVLTASGELHRIRLLGIDAPETVHPDRPVECMGPEASAFTAELASAGTTIVLVFDDRAESTDKYNRRLAHVLIAETNLAQELLYRGLARTTTFPHSLMDVYAQAQDIAQHNHLGMWSYC